MSGNETLFSHGLIPIFAKYYYHENRLPYMLTINGSSLNFVFVWNLFVIIFITIVLSGHPVV